MVQSILLMGMMMPLAWVVSGGQWQGVIMLAVVFLSIRFWTVLFTTANYLDHNLWNAMYPSVGATLSAWDTLMHPLDRILFEILTGFLYVILPLMLTSVMGWAGWGVGGKADRYIEDDITQGAAGRLLAGK